MAGKLQIGSGSVARRRLERKKRRRGHVILEFSLVFVLLMMILVGLMELGRGMWTFSVIAHITREVGRFCIVRGSVNPVTGTQLDAQIEKHCRSTGLDPSKVTVTTSWNGSPTPASISRGDTVEVTLSYPFQIVAGALILGHSEIDLSSTSRMVIAN